MKLHVTFYPNGKTLTCDETDGAQVPELQPPWFGLFLAFLESKDVDAKECKFSIVKNGMVKSYRPFKTSDGEWNWLVE